MIHLLFVVLFPPADLLPPLSAEPRRVALPAWLENPDLPPPPALAVPARVMLPVPARPVRPQSPPEGLPLVYHRSDPATPQHLELPAGERVRVASVDVNEPIALPKLTVRPVEATPAEDPTAAASTAAALRAAPPARINPAPYLRLTLPDPFEHRDTVRLPRPSTDDQPPPLAPVRLPEYKR